MRSALEIAAFSHGSELVGILNLLEVAQATLDSNGHDLAAVYLDMAIIAVSDVAGVTEFESVPLQE